jgi:hypothetical protein
MVTTTFRQATGRSATIDRLRQSLDTVLHAVAITPDSWQYRRPVNDPDLDWLGSWSVADNLAHMAVYEAQVAAPVLEAIAAGRDGTADVVTVSESDYESLWQALATAPIGEIAEELSEARSRQIAALEAMSDERFHVPATTLWQEEADGIGHPAAWVAAKTVQHTWEHGSSIFRIALFAPWSDEALPADSAAPLAADRR